ncbi:hypothetical protein [Endozoicomonas atrinae]|uniref:hypothetical protein n=1 Tax=Endozoicomonas atrinae TaxID=1333660 RepID=UPI0008245150|nr:hypothetical protein [Endozoicomonas atrinae]
MALPNSGRLSLADIATEFGGTAPHKLSEYYGSGNVPASGVLKLSDFYGESAFTPTHQWTIGVYDLYGFIQYGYLAGNYGDITPKTVSVDNHTSPIRGVRVGINGSVYYFEIDFSDTSYSPFLGKDIRILFQDAEFIITGAVIKSSRWLMLENQPSGSPTHNLYQYLSVRTGNTLGVNIGFE